MIARAYVQRDFARFGVSVWLGRFGDETVDLVEPSELVLRRTSRDEAATVQEPSLRIPEDMARALLDALTEHFGGYSDMQRLHADYQAERKRVDKMIDHLTSGGDRD